MRRPASEETTSDSEELCETENLFLTHPTYGNRMFDSQRFKEFLPQSI